jgi:hypothetical protein
MQWSTVLLALLSSKLCRTSVAVDYGWAVMLFGFALIWVVHRISESSHALGRSSMLAPGAILEGGGQTSSALCSCKNPYCLTLQRLLPIKPTQHPLILSYK